MGTERFQQWYKNTVTFNYGGHRIVYKAAGHGESLLLIHGYPSASWDWHKVWDVLSIHYRVVALDMIGYGMSDKPHPHKYSFEEQVAIHASLLRKLGISKVHILAHDYGDTVVQEMLAQQQDGTLPFEIASVCLLNGGIIPEAISPRLMQRVLLSPIAPLIAPLIPRSAFDRTFNNLFAEPLHYTELDNFWKLIITNKGKRIIPEMQKYLPERTKRRARWVGALQNTDIPLRLVVGLKDPVNPTLHTHYRNLIPSPDLVELPDVGHYPQIEAPVDVVRAYFEFRGILTPSDDEPENTEE